MDKRTEMINGFYDGYGEDTRLLRSRHGQLEYLTTMKYIHQVIPEQASIMEVGAGTGKYSVALAKEGYDVAAIELAKSNLELLRQNSKGLENITSYQGDALDLSRFQDNTLFVLLRYHEFIYRIDTTSSVPG